jgi:hypothetical protein
MRPAAAVWEARQARCLADTLERSAGRIVAALAGAHPQLLDKARMFGADARALAAAARALQHALDAELGGNHDDAA